MFIRPKQRNAAKPCSSWNLVPRVSNNTWTCRFHRAVCLAPRAFTCHRLEEREKKKMHCAAYRDLNANHVSCMERTIL